MLRWKVGKVATIIGGGHMMGVVWMIIIIGSILIYDFAVNPMICKRKILKHVENIGGMVSNIERLTLKEYLYYVNFTLDGKEEKRVVRFNIFYRSTWK